MLRVFIGFDDRQAVSFHVLAHSLLEHTSIPLQIIPLKLETLPLRRAGLTPFTWSRFLVPWLCAFEGEALFLDADILCTGDIADIAVFPNMKGGWAVAACNTKPQYERAAVMYFNCAHPDNAKLTPEFIETTAEPLHMINWTPQVQWLANRWNLLVGYDDPAWCKGKIPTLIHYTKGVPAWPETANCDYADHWIDARARAFTPAVDWCTLMSSSNHAAEGPGGVKIPAPRVPDAVHQPDHAPIVSSELANASRGRGADGRRS